VLAVCALLLLAVTIEFGQTIGFDFVNFDDRTYVYENDPVVAGLTGRGIAWAFTHDYMGRRYEKPEFHWHPLTWISHMADCQLYGLWPGGHHLTSAVLHAATAILLFLLLLQMTSALWPSALAAALFAVHPLRAESVAWVAERKDVLSGFFFVLTLAAYVRYAKLPFSLARYLTVLALFACGLMAKSMLVTLPCVLLLLDWWPLGRLPAFPSTLDKQPDRLNRALASGPFPFINLLAEKVPFFALAAAACCVTVFAQSEAISDLGQFSFSTRTANAIVAYMTYVIQLFMPVDLAVYYPHPGNSLPTWKVVGSLAALATISILVVIKRCKYPYLLVGWLWYLGMLLPVIGIVQVASQARADRYTYLPQIGLCIALAWGAADLARSWAVPRWTQAIGASLVLTALVACAWRQVSYWRDSETLWKHALTCTTGNWMAHCCLALAMHKQGRYDEAILHYEEALEIQPRDWTAHFNVGNELARQGKLDQAISHYERALDIEPQNARPLITLAMVLVRQGKTREAIAPYEQFLKSEPQDVVAHYNLAEALAAEGRIDKAIEHYRAAVQIEPRFAVAQISLIDALAAQGKPDAAIDQCRKALASAVAEQNGSLMETLRQRLRHYQAGESQRGSH
jgi:tetratricopeptide (TPR) repeat protein